MSNRILFVDDSAHEREQVAMDIADFVPDAEVITESTIEGAIAAFRTLMGIDAGAQGGAGLHAAILDFQLDIFGEKTSMPIFREMLALAPEFARTRVALRTSLSASYARELFGDDRLEFPPMFLSKGHLKDLINWLKGLPKGK